MGVLVDDLLLLARLDQGRPLERRPVDLAAVAADAAADAGRCSPTGRWRSRPGDLSSAATRLGSVRRSATSSRNAADPHAAAAAVSIRGRRRRRTAFASR